MLSHKAKYALQALSLLAGRYRQGDPVLIQEIAKEKKIPLKFLQSILLELKNNMILESYRGRGGGYKLSVPPGDVSVARIIRIIDGPIALLSCVSINFYQTCDNCDEKTCRINPVMAEARDAILKVLEKRTLKDIMDK